MPRGVPLTRITVLEDHELFAEALDVALTLEGHEVRRIPVPARAVSTERLVAEIGRQRPQVVLLDLDLGPAGDGSRLVRPLGELGIAVLVVTSETDRARLGQCLRLGARAIVPKSAALNLVLSRIRCVVTGLPAMPREEREELVAAADHHRRWAGDTQDRLDSLSQREAEVLAELMSGRPVDDIARRSFVSVSTVRTQVKAIRRKLGVSSQLAAVGLAQRSGWRPPTEPTPIRIPDLDDSTRSAG